MSVHCARDSEHLRIERHHVAEPIDAEHVRRLLKIFFIIFVKRRHIGRARLVFEALQGLKTPSLYRIVGGYVGFPKFARPYRRRVISWPHELERRFVEIPARRGSSDQGCKQGFSL